MDKTAERLSADTDLAPCGPGCTCADTEISPEEFAYNAGFDAGYTEGYVHGLEAGWTDAEKSFDAVLQKTRREVLDNVTAAQNLGEVLPAGFKQDLFGKKYDLGDPEGEVAFLEFLRLTGEPSEYKVEEVTYDSDEYDFPFPLAPATSFYDPIEESGCGDPGCPVCSPQPDDSDDELLRIAQELGIDLRPVEIESEPTPEEVQDLAEALAEAFRSLAGLDREAFQKAVTEGLAGLVIGHAEVNVAVAEQLGDFEDSFDGLLDALGDQFAEISEDIQELERRNDADAVYLEALDSRLQYLEHLSQRVDNGIFGF